MIRRPAFFVLAALALLAWPGFAQTNPVVFSNYGRYDAAPPPDWRQKIDPVVDAVIATIKRGGTASIHIDGHADFDAQGEDFSTRVSQERASAAQQPLMTQILARSQLEGIPREQLLQRLHLTLAGWGTKKALHPASSPMSERVRNRRVEISWSTTGPQPRPRPEPPPAAEPVTLKVVGFGVWTSDARVTLTGEQVVRFVVTNNNLLPASLTIEWEIGGNANERKNLTLLPSQTKEVEFSIFGGRGPRTWSFKITQVSQTLVVSWSALSFTP